MEMLTHYWWLVPVTGFAGVLTAATGAGGGILLLALMGLVFPVGTLLPVHGVVMSVQNGSRLAMLWKHVDWSFVGLASVGSVLGAILVGPLAVNMPDVLGKMVMGVGLLYLIWMPKFSWERDFYGKALLVAVVTSVMCMLIGGAGVLFNAIRKRDGRPKESLLAEQSAIMLLQHALKALVFGLAGFVFGPFIPLMVLMIAAGMVGTWVGVHMLRKMTNHTFDLVFKAMVTVVAVVMLLDAWQNW